VLSNGISENNRVIWIEQGSLKHVGLVPELNAKPVAVKNAEFGLLVDVGITHDGHIVAAKKDGSGRIIKLVESGVKSVHNFKDDVSLLSFASTLNEIILQAFFEDQSQPIYTGNMDESGRVHIARIYWAPRVGVCLILPCQLSQFHYHHRNSHLKFILVPKKLTLAISVSTL